MMRAISLWQPWATLMAIEAKRWETRGRYTHVNGEVAICSAKKCDVEILTLLEQSPYAETLEAHGYTTNDSLPWGKVVAVGRLTTVLTTQEWVRRHVSHNMSRELKLELAFGDYGAGRYAWRFENMRRLTTPIDVKGAQGFFFLPPITEALVRKQLAA